MPYQWNLNCMWSLSNGLHSVNNYFEHHKNFQTIWLILLCLHIHSPNYHHENALELLAQEVPKICTNPGPAGRSSSHCLALWPSGPLMCTTRPINHLVLLTCHAFSCTPLESIQVIIHSVALAWSIDLPWACRSGHMAISSLAIAKVGLKVVNFWLTLVSNVLGTIKNMEILFWPHYYALPWELI